MKLVAPCSPLFSRLSFRSLSLSLSLQIRMASTPRFLLATARQVAVPRRAFSVTPRRGNATQVDPLKPKPWTRQEVQEVYDTPLFELLFRSVSFSLFTSREPTADPTFRIISLPQPLSLSMKIGFSTPIESPSRSSSTLYFTQYQNWRLFRRLLVLRSIKQVRRQGRIESRETHGCRDCAHVSQILHSL